MFNDIGRLDEQQKKEVEQIINNFFASIDDRGTDNNDTMDKMFDFCKTPNYFLRDFIGKTLAKYKDNKKIDEIIGNMLINKIYGIRATALFYLFYTNLNDPLKLLEYVDKFYNDNPWESETIIMELWKRHKNVMKNEIVKWLSAEDEKKRALALYGIENLTSDDPQYTLSVIDVIIDDNSQEVQKKISHLVFLTAKIKPELTFPYLRKWLAGAGENREKLLWVTMKKIVNFLIQKNGKEKSNDFIILTRQVISDWRQDNSNKVSSMGKKLSNIVSKYG